MRKNKEQKKGSENTIGKIIYGFLLFMPLIAIGVTCGYAMFNKNAYKSFDSVYQQEEKSYINDSSNLVIDNDYYFTNVPFGQVVSTTTTLLMSVDNVKNESTNTNIENGKYFRFVFQSNGFNSLQIRETENGSNLYTIDLTNTVTTFSFTYKGELVGSSNYQYLQNMFYTLTFVGNTIDNVFYYSVDKVTDSPLFNWAENSIIYTTTASTCTALSITTPFIPLLMSYWLIISVIYFLYDIILILIWAVHDKIHDLKESIS